MLNICKLISDNTSFQANESCLNWCPMATYNQHLAVLYTTRKIGRSGGCECSFSIFYELHNFSFTDMNKEWFESKRSSESAFAKIIILGSG